MSITSRKFSNKWKISRVIPLYKGGRKSQLDPSSYRPISLLPVAVKLVEMEVHRQIMNFMDGNRLWNSNNHVYRKYHSTTSAMLQLSDKIFEAADKNS